MPDEEWRRVFAINCDGTFEKIPLGRVGKPEEVAKLIAYLASEELSFATRACFDISGGSAVY